MIHYIRASKTNIIVAETENSVIKPIKTMAKKSKNVTLIRDNGKGKVTINKVTSSKLDREIKKALRGITFDDVTKF